MGNSRFVRSTICQQRSMQHAKSGGPARPNVDAKCAERTTSPRHPRKRLLHGASKYLAKSQPSTNDKSKETPQNQSGTGIHI
mmetsp:Transcript_102703/g.257486  ORF Transcript_102703/g.257486 Transcript_102703/m.257486 type:complete len:82 (-) Transcript_102703:1487-1732(-)